MYGATYMAVTTFIMLPFESVTRSSELQRTVVSNVYLVESRPQSLQCIPLAKGRDVVLPSVGNGG